MIEDLVEGGLSEEVMDDVGEASTEAVGAIDPNEKAGPAGIGEARIVRANDELFYTVYFENIPTAAAPAQEVFVTDDLDPNLDWGSFRLTEIAWGDQIVAVPGDDAAHYSRVTVPDYRPEVNKSWWVDVEVQLYYATGEMLWALRTLDPDTGELPVDPLAGFLPPNDETGRGEGHVSFTVLPRADIANGTVISNQASIVFDVNDPIVTNVVTNTVLTYGMVNSAANSGPGTLRNALPNAQSGDLVFFDPAIFPTDNPVTLTVFSPLPSIGVDGLTIDGSYAGVILDGGHTFDGTNGLVIDGAEDVVIKGLHIVNFPGAAVYIDGGANSNRIGSDGPGEGNIIAHNGGHGVAVYGSASLHNTITRNSIHDNAGMGILLREGGNAELPAPVILGADLGAGTVTGTACANCTVEIFTDGADEGAIFEGQTTANGAGDFAFDKGAPLNGPNLTGTATDADGNTSEFSAPWPVINTPPAFAGLPNIIFDESSSIPGTIDLWAYAGDAQTDASGLTYTLEVTPAIGVVVTLTENRYVHAEPSTDWCGWTDVTVRVTDPDGLWDTDTFRAAVTWSCKGTLPVPDQAAAQDEPITLDLTEYEPLIGDGSGMYWYVTGEDHCTVIGERSEDDVLTFTPEKGYVGEDVVTLHMVYPWYSVARQDITLTWGTPERPPLDYRLYLPAVMREYR
jgi:hypothetical protein